MNLSTIDMTREEAAEALAEWGAAVKAAKVREEDAAIAAGYEAIAKGRKLLALSSTIAAGGEDDHYRPRLAVAPVSANTIYLARDRDGTVHFAISDRPDPHRWSYDVGPSGVTVRRAFGEIDWNTEREYDLNYAWRGCTWRAMVPIVPPRFRTRGWRSCHVLFEAEWARHTPPAPVDPALIRHLRGDLWEVRGVWDLTPLERAVLMERNT